MEKEKIKVIIDTDPGVDDAAALLYAFGSDLFDITLISAAGGNSPIDNITANAIHVTEIFHKEIPVVRGAEKPLCREAKYATKAQGKYGFGSYKYNRKKLMHTAVEGEACDVIFETLKKNKTKTTLALIGPMTNIAKLIQKHPTCRRYIDKIVFLGGTKEKIYGRPYKEFNIGYDPEAADVVLKSKIPLVMVPMELGHIAYLNHDEIKRFKKANKIGKTFAKMFEKYRDYHVGKLGAAVHDTCVFYYLAHPDLVATESARIEIKYYKKDEYDFGYIEADLDSKKPNALICMDLDIDTFKQELFDILEKRLSNVK
ncbi:MAG: nucleoside hydrolase [Clostridia bacterium]|nr:nucleoside hydrolase [Clostridia bacterium]